MNNANKPTTRTVAGITWTKTSGGSWIARVGGHAAILRKRSYGWCQVGTATLEGSWWTLNEAMKALAASIKPVMVAS